MYSMQQSGQGLFGSLARFIIPAARAAVKAAAPTVKSVAKSAARNLLEAGVTTAAEALHNSADVKQSAERNLKRAAADTLDTVLMESRKKPRTSINRVRRRRKASHVPKGHAF